MPQENITNNSNLPNPPVQSEPAPNEQTASEPLKQPAQLTSEAPEIIIDSEQEQAQEQ